MHLKIPCGYRLIKPLKSLSLSRCDCDFKCRNLKQSLGVDILSIQVNITPGCIPEYLTDDESALVQVKVCCRQATKPLPEPMLTKTADGIWRASLGHNEFNS